MSTGPNEDEGRFDAIVCGGGVAGSTTAAALAAEGLKVLVCEAGLPTERRLAGELMHPPAAQVLEDLGLLSALEDAGGAPVYGFAVFQGADDPGLLLKYSEIEGGRPSSVAIEHATLTRTLLTAVGERPGVTVWDQAKVLEVVDQGGRTTATVRIDGEERKVSAPLLVCADGRASNLRKGAKIEVEKTEPFRMIGWRIPGGRLPHPGHGHVFTGGPSATLAYQISKDDVRIMFDLELDDDLDVSAHLEAIPRPFRDDVERAIETEPRRTAKVWSVSPRAFSRGRQAVVGDAGGCVHPLTATGIAFCTQDAMRLAREVGEDFRGGSGVPAALRRYARGRAAPMRARSLLGPAMVEALTCPSPEMRLLRHGLFRYWAKSPRGRSVSLGLLSTQEHRPAVMMREYANVCLHALSGVREGVVTPAEALPAMARLAKRNAEHLFR